CFQPLARIVSTIALVALLALTIVLNLHQVIDFLASRDLVPVLLLLADAIASPHYERRVVLGLGTAQRNVAAATIVAIEDIKNPDTLVLVVIASVIGLAVLIPVARWLRAKGLAPPRDTDEVERTSGPLSRGTHPQRFHGGSR